MENITDVDYRHAKRVFKNLNEKIQLIIMIYMFKAIHYYLLMYLGILKTNVLKLAMSQKLSIDGFKWKKKCVKI